MVDRAIVYDAALPQTTDMLNTNKFGLQGLGWALQAILGSSVQVAGLACNPTVPNSLQVTVSPGTIYALDETDASAYGDLGIDTTIIVKEGILNQAVNLTITPPVTVGFSQVYLVEAILFDQDAGLNVLPYFNPANSSEPYNGPGNDGLPNFTIRQTTCAIALKAGVPATTGTEVAPSPDAGYVGLWTIDVPNGLTQITSSFIKSLQTAPRFPTLPAVPNDVQNNEWCYGVDTGVANAYAATVATTDRQPLTTLQPGTICYLKVLNSNSGASTFNLNGLGAVSIVRSTGANVASGDIVANGIVSLMYDGTHWQMLNFQGASTTGSNVINTINIPYAVDSGSANAYVGPFSPAITSLTAGLVVMLKIAHNNTGASTMQANSTTATTLVDMYGNALTANVLQAGEVAIMIYDGTVWRLAYVSTQTTAPSLQIFTSSGTYTPTTGKTKALVICTGGGGAGGANNGGNCNMGTGGIAGTTAIGFLSLSGLSSQAVTVGAGGAPSAVSATKGTQGGGGGQSSVGSLVVASGGPGGFNSFVQNNAAFYVSDPRGNPTGTGLMVMPGGSPTPQVSDLWTHYFSPNGGESFWGGGGGIGGNQGGNIGYPATGFGNGGGGGGSQTQGTSGSQGVVFILEF